MNSIITKTTIHGLNYSVSDEFDEDIGILQYYNREDIKKDISMCIESRSLMPDLLSFICFMVLFFMVLNGYQFKNIYYYPLICLLVHFISMLIRDSLIIYKTLIIPILCMIYQAFSSKFIDKIIILALSYFVLNNVLIGIIYIVGSIMLNIFFPIDNVYFNNKITAYVYHKYENVIW